MRPSRDKDGYRQLSLSKDGRKTTFKVHRLVLETFTGTRPVGTEACHGSGDLSDNRLQNLRWDTKQANDDDRRKHGTVAAGERHFNAKLVATDVERIRDQALSGCKQREIAKRFRVSETTICNLIQGTRWRHLVTQKQQLGL